MWYFWLQHLHHGGDGPRKFQEHLVVGGRRGTGASTSISARSKRTNSFHVLLIRHHRQGERWCAAIQQYVRWEVCWKFGDTVETTHYNLTSVVMQKLAQDPTFLDEGERWLAILPLYHIYGGLFFIFLSRKPFINIITTAIWSDELR